MKNATTNTSTHQIASAPIFKAKLDPSKLFEAAIEFANDGYKLKAVEAAREALIFAKQSNDYIAVYIHSFLAVLNTEFKNFSSARIHCYNANNRLNKTHYSYEVDKLYIESLLRRISSLDIEMKQLEFEALAA